MIKITSTMKYIQESKYLVDLIALSNMSMKIKYPINEIETEI